MRWVVRIEREDDGSESDAIRIERSQMEDAAGPGLTLEDGKRVMVLLQKRVLADQLREHCRLSRLCSVCARTRTIKDCQQRVIDTIFGRENFKRNHSFSSLSAATNGRNPHAITGG